MVLGESHHVPKVRRLHEKSNGPWDLLSNMIMGYPTEQTGLYEHEFVEKITTLRKEIKACFEKIPTKTFGEF
jgi:hypothetical protein